MENSNYVNVKGLKLPLLLRLQVYLNLQGITVYVMHRSYIVNCSGALCITYPGDSSMESRVNRDRRKNKVSCTMLINAGLVEPKGMLN
jgi:hypothetical protein